MRWNRVRSALSMTIGVTIAGGMSDVFAQAGAQGSPAYPTRPVRVLVGSPPGGSGDIGARLLSAKLSERFGQSFVVENKTGATGAIAAAEVARADPDGHVLLFTASWHSTAAAVKKSLPYDTLGDFTFISTFTTYGMMIGVRTDSRFKRLEELVAFGKANPGKLSYYSVGSGSGHHLVGEWFNALTGAELLHVPYRGSAIAFPDFLSGRVDVMIDTMTFALTQALGGKVRPLAITSREPMPELPGVPLASIVAPELEYESWLGLLGPKNLPARVLDLLNQGVRAAVAAPDTAARLKDIGAIPRASSPEEFRRRCAQEIDRFKEVVAKRRIPME